MIGSEAETLRKGLKLPLPAPVHLSGTSLKDRTKAEPAAGVQWIEHVHEMQETRGKPRVASYLQSPGCS